ncbi:MAG: cytidine deaminase [Balneolaceae bacterium]
MNWKTLLSRSYSPNSNNPAAAIIEADNGLFYPGVRIENISHPLTITAVQAAAFSALADGAIPEVLYLPDNTPEPLTEFWINEYDLKKGGNSFPDSASFYDPVLADNTDINIELKELTVRSVIPNSDFPVTALLEVEFGFIPGVNVECSAWNLGLCAERVAVLRALSSGYREFKSIWIYAPKADFVSPCGACRQVLSEWMNQQKVHLNHGDGSSSSLIFSHLLPYGFTSSSLRKK